MGRQFSLLAAVLRALLGAGGLIFLLGPILLADQLESPYLGLVGAVLVIALILHAGLRPGLSSGEYGQHRRQAGFGDRLEQLYDLQWELREAETRCRDLLDRQSNLVSKCDARGLLTYVNQAFCDAFGVTDNEVLGTDFRPTVLEEEPEPQAHGELPRHRRLTQRLETNAGPRWFACEQYTSPAPGAGGSDTLRICRDITEERTVVAMLSQAREQAEVESREKSRFLAALSQEVRGPIEGIVGLSDQLMSTRQTREQVRHSKRIGSAARSLLELMDQAIDLSKIEAGRPQMELTAFDLENCLQEVAERLAGNAHRKGLELGWTLDAGVPERMVGDEARIRRILLNLIGNAIDSTEHGGVLVTATLAPAPVERMTVAIRVEDTGCGLEPDAGLALVISRKLARAMGGDIVVENESGQGSVLTLELPLPLGAPTPAASVAGRCVPPMRGLVCSSLQIEGRALTAELRIAGAHVTFVESDHAEGVIARAASAGEAFDLVLVDGATSPEFAAVLLACAKEQNPGGRVRGCVLVTARQLDQLDAFRVAGLEDHLVRPVRRSSLRALLGLRRCAEAGVAPPPQLPSAARGSDLTAGTRVLIAEDDTINALLTQCMVCRAGCTSLIVKTGRSAVDAVRSSLVGTGPAIHLVLMDVHMPDLDGLAAAREIRNLSAGSPNRSGTGRSRPPLIAITASAFAEDRQSCLEAGMDDYLAKPFSWPEFQAVLARWLPPCTRNAGKSSERKDDAA